MADPGAATPPAAPRPLRIGVLALQGSFREHIAALRRCGTHPLLRGRYAVDAREVRRAEELGGLQGLVIPGGESTTMAHVAERNGMIPALREFEASGAPIWGTCAGLIFLADRALGQKMGGQALLGGLDCTVHRNFFGSQINSFETCLPAPLDFQSLATPPPSSGSNDSTDSSSSGSSSASDEAPFRAVFIRAPAIIETGPEVRVLSEYEVTKGKVDAGEPRTEEEALLDKLDKVAVAVKQGCLLATAFHPELTSDLRWHLLFLRMVLENMEAKGAPADNVEAVPAQEKLPGSSLLRKPPSDPGYLPVYGSTDTLKVELQHK